MLDGDDLAARRARILATLRVLPEGTTGTRFRAGLTALRRHADALVAVLLGVGVLAMILR